MIKERITEAEENVRTYIAEGLLKRQREDKVIAERYASNARESLDIADLIFTAGKSPLWVIVCSYYSMYYIANGVLRSLGYAVGRKISHKITADALVVFVRGRLRKRLLEDFEEAQAEASELAELRADEIVQHFDMEKEKRSIFQYDMTEVVKRSKAETSLKRAKEFVAEMEKLLPKSS
jgi:uncharacterized protein (UPF0332 family)